MVGCWRVLLMWNSACLLFFQPSGDPRDLHSFPTRRSSDLADDVVWRVLGTSLNLASPIANWRDRKSTRLNSSHLGISYAVFCLKKKNRYDPCGGQVSAREQGQVGQARSAHRQPPGHTSSPS